MAGRNGIILLGQNLFFQGRVDAVAAPLGYRVRQAQTEADFWADYADGGGNGDGDGDGDTALVLVDLEGDADTWAVVLAGLQRRAQPDAGAEAGAPSTAQPAVRIVAFGPHEDTASMEKAKTLGCHLTLNKGRFSATLGEIIGGGGG